MTIEITKTDYLNNEAHVTISNRPDAESFLGAIEKQPEGFEPSLGDKSCTVIILLVPHRFDSNESQKTEFDRLIKNALETDHTSRIANKEAFDLAMSETKAMPDAEEKLAADTESDHENDGPMVFGIKEVEKSGEHGQGRAPEENFKNTTIEAETKSANSAQLEEEKPNILDETSVDGGPGRGIPPSALQTSAVAVGNPDASRSVNYDGTTQTVSVIDAGLFSPATAMPVVHQPYDAYLDQTEIDEAPLEVGCFD